MTEKEINEFILGNIRATAAATSKAVAAGSANNMNPEEILAALVKSATATVLGEISDGKKTGTDIVDLEALIPDWKKEGKAGDGVHEVGEVVRFRGQVVKCCQAHNTNNNPDITPDNLTFYVPYHTTDPYKAKPFVQPVHAESAYYIGEVCLEAGVVYRSKIDSNTFSPSADPNSWEVVEIG